MAFFHNNQTPDTRPDPWENDTYQTGPTRPRKARLGLLAVLLTAAIFLCGIVSGMSLLKLRLFERTASPDSPDYIGVSLTGSADPATLETSPTAVIYGMDATEAVLLETTPPAVENVPQQGGLSLQQIYAQTIDSVVSILCTYSNGTSSGTGVVLTGDGYIVTNCHVVENAPSIEVLFTDGRVMKAQLIGQDSVTDLAVIRVDAQDLTAAHLGDSSTSRVGDAVVAIGDPLGIELRGTMTDGIISAINRDISVEGRTMSLIQTNAALNSGNSGGPLLNCYGQVIGINTLKIGDYVSSAGVEGLGFAIPTTTVRDIVNQLIEQGYVSGRPNLGLSGESVSPFYQMYYRLPQGLSITHVDPDSGAYAAGIRSGDILLSIGESRIYGLESYQAALYSLSVGEEVTVIIYRGGRQYSVGLTVEESNH